MILIFCRVCMFKQEWVALPFKLDKAGHFGHYLPGFANKLKLTTDL